MTLTLKLRYLGKGQFETIGRFDRNLADRCPVNAEYTAVLKPPRNLGRHRLFFKWLDKVWLNIPEDNTEFPTAERLRYWLMVQCGICRTIRCDDLTLSAEMIEMLKHVKQDMFFEFKNGELWCHVPNSIAWENMSDEDEFAAFFKRAQDIVSTEILPGTTLEDLLGALQDAG